MRGLLLSTVAVFSLLLGLAFTPAMAEALDYDISTYELIGEYELANNSEKCSLGHQVCDGAIIYLDEEGSLRISFESYDPYDEDGQFNYPLEKGDTSFGFGESDIFEDCQDPGCVEATSVDGVVRGLNIENDGWAVKIEVDVTIECMHSDDFCESGESYDHTLTYVRPDYISGCADRAMGRILGPLAKELNVATHELQIRYIGGETFDGDTASDNEYLEPSIEYYDVFVEGEHPETALPLLQVAYNIDSYTDNDTGEVLRCEYEEAEVDSWERVYDLYL